MTFTERNAPSQKALPVLLLAAVASLLAMTLGRRVERVRPGSAGWIRAQERADRHVEAWPEASREMAFLMITRLGPPDKTHRDALTWYGRHPWKRITVRENRPEAPLEQGVDFAVPAERLAQVLSIGHGVSVSRELGELSARGASEQEVFVAVNLAAEVARGQRKPEEARRAYNRVEPDSIYRRRLLFEPR